MLPPGVLAVIAVPVFSRHSRWRGTPVLEEEHQLERIRGAGARNARTGSAGAARETKSRSRLGMERSLAGATSGNRWQMGKSQAPRKQAKSVAAGCHWLPRPQNGKECHEEGPPW